MIDKYKSGYVSIIGEPNAGKSTLINRLISENVSIISPVPQTTLKRISGILTSNDYQIIFVDTPGIFKKIRHRLDEKMVNAVEKSIKESDIIVLLIAKNKLTDISKYMLEKSVSQRKPLIVVLNKVDEFTYSSELYNQLEEYKILKENIVEASAKTGRNILILLKKIIGYLPAGPRYFFEDIYTTQSIRDMVSEIIREQIFYLAKFEIPHSAAVKTDEFRERKNGSVFIHSTIYVEKESQKKIIIGNNGAMIKKIGTGARQKIENWLNKKVFLELFAKVSKNWRKNDPFLKDYIGNSN